MSVPGRVDVDPFDQLRAEVRFWQTLALVLVATGVIVLLVVAARAVLAPADVPWTFENEVGQTCTVLGDRMACSFPPVEDRLQGLLDDTYPRDRG